MDKSLDLLTPREAAEVVRFKEATLSFWRSRGKGPKYYKLHNTVFYDRQDLIDWMRKGAVPTESD